MIADAGADDETKDGGSSKPVTCGDGTKLVDGKCVPNATDAGPTTAQKKPVGAGCMDGSECATDFCAPNADNLPGGMCTILGCSMDKPCPMGSTCYQLNKSTSLCMAFCDRDAECRKDENYHCQPLYTNGINICAPSCTLSKSCTAGTRCNAESGLCELAECDVASPGDACHDDETCWTDSRGLSSKGGLCLHMCKPGEASKSCVTDKNEVCQPLADDPENHGFCAPPVCSKTAECPAGAICKDSVCQPPQLCDDEHHCPDDATCVAGKCMSKCPTGDGKCSDIHPSLVCASSLSTPACLPLGSFPGSDCRTSGDKKCDDVTSGGMTAPMVCQDNKCLPDCTGKAGICSSLSDTLQCAHGVFATDLCLPKGSYPGSACGANNTCAQNLNGDENIDMQCVSGTCVVGCSESGKWSGYGDALCSLLDASLTCAESAGNICVLHCNDQGKCSSGSSCLDPGTPPSHQNACLPDGTFPGSTCRPASGDECDQNVGGQDAVDMTCVNNTCVVKCPSNNDGLCAAVSTSLTCAESAGNICVLACGANGACPSGYSCLDAGGQNACLPNGTFPGSVCRSGDNKCDQNVGGNDNVDMVCVNNTCTPACPNNNDGLCMGVDTHLTCSESAGNVCVFACVSGACPTGYSCLDPGGQNACLPIGSFPGSPCRSTQGDECDQNVGGQDAVDMVCVSGTCTVSCPGNNDQLCGQVDSHLTCSESAGNVCVVKCVSGQCLSGYSCLSPGAEDACLPTGSFPGSPCAPGNLCAQNLGGNDAVDMVCVSGTCTVSCPNNADNICSGVDSHLTCAESAGNLCVLACDGNGACPTGYSCLDAGASPHQNACLPDGTFPGSKCRTTQNDECDQSVGGNNAVNMECFGNTCVVTCTNDNDQLCGAVNTALTCSANNDVCLPKCVSGQCLPGNTCSNDNACEPN